MSGTDRITAERQRQVAEECWTPAHDDEHDSDELAWAAVAYAAPECVYRVNGGGPCITFNDSWPRSWGSAWDKRGQRPVVLDITYKLESRIRELVKAGALIAAEIDRLERLEENRSHGDLSTDH